jgi:hypothetical protein
MEGDLIEMRFGKFSVRENLERAVKAGRLTPLDGNYILPEPGMQHSYLHVKTVRKMDCRFLNGFLFEHAYDKKTVPFGCSNCYKVKIVPEDFRGLIALRELLENAPYHSKCGADFYNPHSRDFYAGFLYLDGLEVAHAACLDMRARCNDYPGLGRAVITIKRGCSNMEAVCGSSDRWLFRDGMQELESYLKARVQIKPSVAEPYPVLKIKSLASWIQLAYNIRDDSYHRLLPGG